MRYDDLKKKLEDKQLGKDAGIPISSSFPNLRKTVGSFSPGEQILISASEGAGKTRFTIRMIFEVIQYMVKNPTGMKARILYNSLELPAFEVYLILLSYLFYKNLGKVYTRDEMLNLFGEKHINKQFFEDLEKIKSSINYFNSVVTVIDDINTVEGWYKYCKKVLDEQGDIIEGKYVKKNPNLLTIIITDTVNAFSVNEPTKTNAIKKWSGDYCKLQFRKFYQSNVINIIQQDKASQSTQFTTQGKRIEEKYIPSSSTMKDAKDLSDDSNTVIGLLNPSKFHLQKWFDYDVKTFNKNLLFIHHLKTNFSELQEPFPMWFEFQNLTLEEIPDINKHPILYENFLKKKGLISVKETKNNKLNNLLFNLEDS